MLGREVRNDVFRKEWLPCPLKVTVVHMLGREDIFRKLRLNSGSLTALDVSDNMLLGEDGRRFDSLRALADTLAAGTLEVSSDASRKEWLP